MHYENCERPCGSSPWGLQDTGNGRRREEPVGHSRGRDTGRVPTPVHPCKLQSLVPFTRQKDLHTEETPPEAELMSAIYQGGGQGPLLPTTPPPLSLTPAGRSWKRVAGF